MSRFEEVGKTFYLIKERRVCGIFRIEERDEMFVPWYQLDPFGDKKNMRSLKGDHARSVFNEVCAHFQRKKMAVQTMPETITPEEYRDSMWILFKELFLPKELVAQIEAKAREGYVTGCRLIKLEIEIFDEMYPYDEDVVYKTVWEKWHKKWRIKR